MRRLTLAARLTVFVIVCLVAVWVMAIASYYRARDARAGEPAPERIAALARIVEATAPGARADLMQAVAADGFKVGVHPVSPAGPLPGAPPDPSLRDRYERAFDGRPFAMSDAPRDIGLENTPTWYRAPTGALHFRIALSTGETLVVETQGPLPINRFGLPVGFGAGLIGTLIAVVALVVMYRETRPLARLAEAVDSIDLTNELAALPNPRYRAPEIRALIVAFDRLQRRLAGMVQGRMALIGGISHDVRTFATRLRLRVEGIGDPDERQRAIDDIDDMVALLDDALLSSRAGAGELAQEMVEPAEIAAREVEDRRARGDEVTLRIAAGAETAVVLGDRLALRRVLANLVDNALKYGGAARIELCLRGEEVLIQVDDDGPGIPPGRRAAMLEPFSRLESSRNRATGGAGLGLAIARTLVEGHGGAIEIADAPSGGARLIVSLPLFKAA